MHVNVVLWLVKTIHVPRSCAFVTVITDSKVQSCSRLTRESKLKNFGLRIIGLGLYFAKILEYRVNYLLTKFVQ